MAANLKLTGDTISIERPSSRAQLDEFARLPFQVYDAFLIGLTLGLVSFLWLPSRTALAQAGCVTARNLNPSALRGDTAEGDWLSYRNTKNGLSFRYPPSMRVEERDPAKFGFDNVPDVIVDLRGNALNSPNIIVMRFICDRGQKTPELAAARARALLETHPKERPYRARIEWCD